MTKEKAGVLEIEGNEVAVTHPGKMLWPEPGIRKIDYLQRLVILAPYLLPYCRDRYMTMIRFPDGVEGISFYQKNAPGPLPGYVKYADKDAIRYVNVDCVSTLLWLGNLGVLEFHPSFERIGTQEPSEWVLDMDPGGEHEPRLMEAVSYIGEALQKMGIESVPKTSGATGVQIIVPVQGGYTFGRLHKLGEFLGHFLSQKYPRLFTIERHIKAREGRIYIDYAQHAAGKSLAAPYSPRGRKEATVSTPLTWEEVRSGVDPRSFHLMNIEERLRGIGDLMASIPPQNLDTVLNFIEKQSI